MDTLCKKYLKNIKLFFPIMGKQEKDYLKNLKLSVSDFCHEKSITSMDELYRDFGTPSEVAHSYFSNVKMDYILTKINIAKKIKIALIVFITLFFIGVTVFSSCLFLAYNQMQKQLIFFEETTIK